jgi:hypothetical protein
LPQRFARPGPWSRFHDDHFSQDATDPDWILEVGKRKWLVLTKDDNIRYRPLEKRAVKVAAVGLFALKAGNVRGAEMAQAFVVALPALMRLATRVPPPFIARVSRIGIVTLLDDFA